MSVQVMRDPRPPVPVSGSTFRATLEEKSVAFSGYYAYWGSYTLNAVDSTVIHQVTASLWPQEVGITYKRTYALAGDRLVLTTPSVPNRRSSSVQPAHLAARNRYAGDGKSASRTSG